MVDLLERRRLLLTEFAAMEKYDPHVREEAQQGRKLTERPLAFQQDDEVVIVGECVGKVLAALTEFVKKVDASPGLTEKAGRGDQFGNAVNRSRKLLADPPATLRMSAAWFNTLLLGLTEVGVSVTLTDGL